MTSFLRLTKNSGLSAKTYILSYDDVERQVLQDLAKYKSLCALEGIIVDSNEPLDVDHFAEVVFEATVEPVEIEQPKDEEILGYFDPVNKRIVYDPEVCNSNGRIAFTVAHESGHISLHSCLAVNADIKKWKQLHSHPHIEWQANAYAAFLLAPTPFLTDLLKEEGYVEFGVISEVDMSQFAPKMMGRFGLSWQASEIRLERMGAPMANKKYS